MRATVRKRRRPAKTETERMETVSACAAHLKDLKRAHGTPPPDVSLPSRAAVRLVCPIPDASWCSSPAQMCAELAE
ncbi:MAG TPA: hypothetical protein VEH77_08760 [Roseiarcus sp.]|nr:hypothetical protein [Roseiarcus sp.]